MSAKRYFSDPRTQDADGHTGIVPRIENAIAWWRWDHGGESPAVVAVHVSHAKEQKIDPAMHGVRIMLTNNTEPNVFMVLDETEFADSEAR